jgi:hypothetical protein
MRTDERNMRKKKNSDIKIRRTKKKVADGENENEEEGN